MIFNMACDLMTHQIVWVGRYQNRQIKDAKGKIDAQPSYTVAHNFSCRYADDLKS